MKDTLHRFRIKLGFLSLPLLFLSYIFLDYSFRYLYLFLDPAEPFGMISLRFTLGWALLLTGVAGVLPVLARRIYMVASGALISLLVIVNGVMMNIFGHFFSFSDMSYAGDGARFFSWSYVRLRKALLLSVALSLLMSVLAAVLTRKREKSWTDGPRRFGAAVLAAVGLIVVARTHNSLLPAEGLMLWDSQYDEAGAQYKRFTDPNFWLYKVGLYQYSVRDLCVSMGWENGPASVPRLDRYFQDRRNQISSGNEVTGALQGKNLIMVMMESVDTWMLTEDYMPNLFALRQKSLDFTHFYTPLMLSAGTFNTEIMSQTGLIPTSVGVGPVTYADNSFPLSLPNLFRREGYTARSFHCASPTIYLRGRIHANLGFERYHNGEAMKMDDFQLDSQMLGGYGLMTEKEPFFSYIITYSGHGPYNSELANISAPHLDAARAAVARSGVTGSEENMEEYIHAIAHIMETDAFVGDLLEALEADGKLEDTVLLFYTDHYGKYMTDRQFLCQLKGVSAASPELYHTPCFLYSADLPGKKIDKYASAVDLIPTLINLFGLNVDRSWFVGEDILNGEEGFVIFPNCAWLDGSGYWTGSEPDADRKRAADVRQRTEVCADCLHSDYFRVAKPLG